MQVLVEAKTSDDVVHSLLLQNAETVRLVGLASNTQSSGQAVNDRKESSQASWRAMSVSQLQVGDKVYLRQQGAARHTGISIDERIVER